MIDLWLALGRLSSNRFCKREEDFKTLRDYNDYLEKIEEISEDLYFFFFVHCWRLIFSPCLLLLRRVVFNLVNEVDTETVKLYIESFKQENRELIERNRRKQRSEDTMITQMLEREAEERRRRVEEDNRERQEELLERRKEEQEFMKALANGEPSSKKRRIQKTLSRSSQEINSDTSAFRSFFDIIKRTEGKLAALSYNFLLTLILVFLNPPPPHQCRIFLTPWTWTLRNSRNSIRWRACRIGR